MWTRFGLEIVFERIWFGIDWFWCTITRRVVRILLIRFNDFPWIWFNHFIQIHEKRTIFDTRVTLNACVSTLTRHHDFVCKCQVALTFSKIVRMYGVHDERQQHSILTDVESNLLCANFQYFVKSLRLYTETSVFGIRPVEASIAVYFSF